jgi:hypothetical protein
MQAKEFIALLNKAGACKAGIRTFKKRHKPRTRVEYTLRKWIDDSWFVVFETGSLDQECVEPDGLTKKQRAVRYADVLWPHDCVTHYPNGCPTLRESFVDLTPSSIINDLKKLAERK